MSREVWLALIAAGAAIIASFGAQIIGGIFSRKQEKRRLALEERKLFADTRRVAFVSYLQSRNGFADDIWELYIESDQFRTKEDHQIRKRANGHLSQLEPLKNEISLLAPDVARKIKAESRSSLDLALAGMFSKDHPTSDGPAAVREAAVSWLLIFRRNTVEIEKVMRKSLKIEDRETAADRIEDHETADAFLARLDEARTSGDSEQSGPSST
jgi:hypothetical protein